MRYRRIIWLLALLLATMVCRAQTSIDLTENTDGTWTLDAMPAYDVMMEVEYEDDLSQVIDLTNNGDGTWTLAEMPAYNVSIVVEYEDDLSQAIDLTDNGDGTWTLDQMPACNVKLVVEYENESGVEEATMTPSGGRVLGTFTIDGKKLNDASVLKGVVFIKNGKKMLLR